MPRPVHPPSLLSDHPVTVPEATQEEGEDIMARTVLSGTRYHVPEGWYTRTQVGDEVKRSRSAIKTMEKQGVIAPDGEMPCGKVTVQLYSSDALQHVKEVLKTRRGGRPAKSKDTPAKAS